MNPLKTFHVAWEIDVDATGPQAAAREAHRIMRDKNSTALYFKVQETQIVTHYVDLDTYGEDDE